MPATPLPAQDFRLRLAVRFSEIVQNPAGTRPDIPGSAAVIMTLRDLSLFQ